MRNSKTRTKTIKSRLKKCRCIFYSFTNVQFAYGKLLDNNPDILEIECNVKLKDCKEGSFFTTDFFCKKSDGTHMVRECVERKKLMKPLTIKLLDISRNYWSCRGITDWGVIVSED